MHRALVWEGKGPETSYPPSFVGSSPHAQEGQALFALAAPHSLTIYTANSLISLNPD